MSRIRDPGIVDHQPILSNNGGPSGGMPATLHSSGVGAGSSARATAGIHQLFAFAGAVTPAALGRAVAGFGDFPIRTDARLSMHAPEQAVVRTLHVRVGLGEDELPLPAQGGTQIRVVGVEAIYLANHAAPPAAFRMARLTDTCANFTLYAF